MNLDDIDQSAIALIEKLAPSISDPELKAFFNDLLWIKAKSHIAARNAIHAFVESARYLEDYGHWTNYVPRLSRAAALAAGIRAKDVELIFVASRISETIEEKVSARLMFCLPAFDDCAAGNNCADPQKWAALCETLLSWLNLPTNGMWRELTGSSKRTGTFALKNTKRLRKRCCWLPKHTFWRPMSY